MANLIKWMKSYRLFLILIATILIGIEWLVRIGQIPSFIIPAPSGVLTTMVNNWRPLLFEHTSTTMFEFLIGFLISLTAGVGLAVSMFFFRPVEKMLYPVVVISQMIPVITLSPIFVLWFGYTIWSKVAVTILISIFPIIVGTYDGLKASDKEYVELFRSMGATRWITLLKLHIPMALPSFFSGLKLAVIFALVGAAIGEWFGASEGLGYYSRRMSGNLNAEGVFAAITILTWLGMILFGLVSLIERRVLSWKNES